MDDLHSMRRALKMAELDKSAAENRMRGMSKLFDGLRNTIAARENAVSVLAHERNMLDEELTQLKNRILNEAYVDKQRMDLSRVTAELRRDQDMARGKWKERNGKLELRLRMMRKENNMVATNLRRAARDVGKYVVELQEKAAHNLQPHEVVNIGNAVAHLNWLIDAGRGTVASELARKTGDEGDEEDSDVDDGETDKLRERQKVLLETMKRRALDVKEAKKATAKPRRKKKPVQLVDHDKAKTDRPATASQRRRNALVEKHGETDAATTAAEETATEADTTADEGEADTTADEGEEETKERQKEEAMNDNKEEEDEITAKLFNMASRLSLDMMSHVVPVAHLPDISKKLRKAEQRRRSQGVNKPTIAVFALDAHRRQTRKSFAKRGADGEPIIMRVVDEEPVEANAVVDEEPVEANAVVVDALPTPPPAKRRSPVKPPAHVWGYPTPSPNAQLLQYAMKNVEFRFRLCMMEAEAWLHVDDYGKLHPSPECKAILDVVDHVWHTSSATVDQRLVVLGKYVKECADMVVGIAEQAPSTLMDSALTCLTTQHLMMDTALNLDATFCNHAVRMELHEQLTRYYKGIEDIPATFNHPMCRLVFADYFRMWEIIFDASRGTIKPPRQIRYELRDDIV